ncbi:MAG: phosphoribosylformylglycinamidine cyclo-ligase [Candidatus Peribacteraceae bacterium]|nr:phosphoribosylformylglycinamidine cyclo-ligase [Candidatus Peribacteraceae bacterium]
MTTYKDSGVDVKKGDMASAAAYAHAASTFESRKGMIGEPVFEEDGYAGFLDMGDYYLIQSTDGTGTKLDLAAEMNSFETLGYDLLAMVADDAICVGAEVISLSNCIDVPSVNPKMIDAMMKGLSKACKEQKIAIPAGEIAEVPGAVNRAVWSASAVGIVAKDKVIKPETIVEGDTIISLKSGVARSNGFSLLRKILSDSYGKDWHTKEWKNGTTWGEILMTPSIVYQSAVLSLIGRYREERKIDVKGVAHITGGGIPSKLGRVLRKTGLGANLTDLFSPHEAIVDIIKLGNVPEEETYKTWNMGNGMMLVVSPEDANEAISLLKKVEIEAKTAGTIVSDPKIMISINSKERLFF